jgi:hypothetical protein
MRTAMVSLTMGALLLVAGAVVGQASPLRTPPPPTSCKDVPRWPQACPYEWGEPGFDGQGRSPRFRACCAGAEIQLSVDTAETVGSIGSMTLMTPDGLSLSSQRCYKAQRHRSAPWACTWFYGELTSLAGDGRLRVSDRAGAPLLDAAVDLDRLARMTY